MAREQLVHHAAELDSAKDAKERADEAGASRCIKC